MPFIWIPNLNINSGLFSAFQVNFGVLWVSDFRVRHALMNIIFSVRINAVFEKSQYGRTQTTLYLCSSFYGVIKDTRYHHILCNQTQTQPINTILYCYSVKIIFIDQNAVDDVQRHNYVACSSVLVHF